MEKFKNIPVTEWNKMLRAVERLVSEKDAADVISEKEAANLLGMQVVSLQKRRSEGKIPEGCYKKPVVGNVVYFKSKLLNLG